MAPTEWIAPDVRERILAAFKTHIRDPQVEIECVCRGVGLDAFTRIVRWARASSAGPPAESTVLDVVVQGNRRISVDKSDVATFARTMTIPTGAVAIEKTALDRVVLSSYDVSVNFKREAKLGAKELVAAQAALKARQDALWRLKKRYSFVMAHGLRLDATVVKESRNGGPVAAFASPEAFEIEIEVLRSGDRATGAAAPERLGRLLDLLCETLRVKQGAPSRPIGASAADDVLRAYLALTQIAKPADLPRVKASPRRHFAGPQPVTLEVSDLDKIASMEYTVTDKADGERMLLFAGEDREAFLLDTRLGVVATDVVLAQGSALLDCEVLRGEDGVWTVLVFDAYFVAGRPVYRDALLDRIAAAASAIPAAAGPDKVRVQLKRFVVGSDGAAEVLDSPPVYETDGLIFTPARLPVGATDASSAGRLGGSWTLVYKWKPVNTIDFQVRALGMDDTLASDRRRLFGLFVAADASLAPLTIATVVKDRKPAARGKDVVAVQFSAEEDWTGGVLRARLNAQGASVCEDGGVIRDRDIVECSFSFDDGWIAHRVRHDKTDLLRRTGRVGGAANMMETAMNAWNSTVNPVTEDAIRGRRDAVADPSATSSDLQRSYYSRKEGSRRDSLTYHMRTFHNQWVKQRLYSAFGDARRLCEIACGNANDLNRWLAMPALVDVLGIDVSFANISDPATGAYAKLARTDGARRLRAAFLQLDASRPLDEDAFEALPDADVRAACRVLWGMDIPPSGSALTQYYKFASRRFDLVSCQFAIHYFFESETRLSAFVRNVAAFLAPGGHFIGTCFDAARIEALLEKEGPSASRRSSDGRPIWEIRRKYDGAEAGAFGRRIAVYVESINRVIDEFLVDFDALDAAFAEHGIVPLPAARGSFESEFDAFMSSPSRSRSPAAEMTDAERTLSFLNTRFAYVRVR